MVKIDDTYFEDDLEEELQEPTPVATDESTTEPLLGDLLDEEVSSEAVDTDTQSDFTPAAMAPADDEETHESSTLESTPLAEPEAPEALFASEEPYASEELEEEEEEEAVEEEDEEDIEEESDQSTRKRSSRVYTSLYRDPPDGTDTYHEQLSDHRQAPSDRQARDTSQGSDLQAHGERQRTNAS